MVVVGPIKGVVVWAALLESNLRALLNIDASYCFQLWNEKGWERHCHK